MNKIVYCCPTGGKTFFIKESFTKMFPRIILIDTDDIMMYFGNSLNLYGFRQMSDKFWDHYHSSPDFRDLCFRHCVTTLKEMDLLQQRFLVLTNLKNLGQKFKFDLEFSRKKDDLISELQTRAKKEGKKLRPFSWLDTWSPSESAILLAKGQYIGSSKQLITLIDRFGEENGSLQIAKV